MKETENYHLKQIEDGDKPSEYPSVQSENMRVIDEQMHELATEVTPIERGGTGASTAAAARANLGLDGDIITTKTTQGPAYGPLLSVTANGHAEQDGTPTPSDPKEIRVVRGRNLLDLGSSPSDYSKPTIINGVSDNTVLVNVVGTGDTFAYRKQHQTAVGKVTISATASAPNVRFFVRLRNASDTAWLTDSEATINGMAYNSYYDGWLVNNGNTLQPQKTIDIPDCLYWELGIGWTSMSPIVGTVQSLKDLQLELGSTAHPYVPYGHVGLDVTADGTTTTTPIPLPSRGWVGSLPDGTHDALAIDGAGKVTWVNNIADYVIIGNETAETAPSGDIGTCYRTSINVLNNAQSVQNSSTGLCTHAPCEADYIADRPHFYTTTVRIFLFGEADSASDVVSMYSGAHVYYPLATPTTEDMGYVDLPDIPEGAVVSMPELEGLGVESWTSDAVARYVRAWAARQ